MKFFIKFLIASVLCLPLCVGAQFVQPANVKSVISGTGPFIIYPSAIGTLSTNYPSATTNASYANALTVGPNGFAIGYNIAGTNSLTVTNLYCLFETSSDGVNWTTNQPAGGISVLATPSGTSYKPSYTNLLSTIQNLNLGNLMAIRLYAIANTNGDHRVFITNLTLTTR